MRKLALIFVLLLSSCSGNRMGDFDIGAMLDLHNKEHKPAYHIDLMLQEKAQDHAEWMAKHKSLTHSDLKFPGTDFGWKAENIGWGYTTEKAAFKGWMDSKGHRVNIVNSHYTHVGFGCAKDDEGHKWWCADFGG